jgi:hypothetical protein
MPSPASVEIYRRFGEQLACGIIAAAILRYPKAADYFFARQRGRLLAANDGDAAELLA